MRLHGQFTIHGGAHEVTMAVKAHIENQRLTATIDFQVPYVQWGMKNPSTLFLRVKRYRGDRHSGHRAIKPRAGYALRNGINWSK